MKEDNIHYLISCELNPNYVYYITLHILAKIQTVILKDVGQNVGDQSQ